MITLIRSNQLYQTWLITGILKVGYPGIFGNFPEFTLVT